MWIASTVQNVIVQLLITFMVDYPTMTANSYDLVASLAAATGFNWLIIWLRISATVVCAGGVITAFVGTLGLSERLAKDKCLPPILLRKSKLLGTSHWIIIAFWALTSILVAATNGDITSLAAMFTAAFLSVLLVVAVGNLTFKYRRRKLLHSVALL